MRQVQKYFVPLCELLAYIILIICGLFANIIAFKIVLVAFVALNPIKLFIMYNQRKVRLQLEKANEAKLSEEQKEIVVERN